jgi:hypothetical protein
MSEPVLHGLEDLQDNNVSKTKGYCRRTQKIYIAKAFL